MNMLRELLGSVTGRDRVVLASVVIVALVLLAGLLVWQRIDLAPFWAFLNG